jgi:hypothetical protein
MAQTVSRIILSGSTNGLGIKVTGTSTAATVTLHTAVAGVTSYDLVTLWAVNNDADGETRTLTIEFGGTTDPDNVLVVPIPCKVGPVLVCSELPLRNTLVVKAFADEANDVQVYGSVLRVVES